MNEQIPPMEFPANENERAPLNFEKYREASELMEQKGYTVIDTKIGKSIERGNVELSIWFSDVAQLGELVGPYLMSSDSEEKCTLLKPLEPKEVDTETFEKKFWNQDDEPIM